MEIDPSPILNVLGPMLHSYFRVLIYYGEIVYFKRLSETSIWLYP